MYSFLDNSTFCYINAVNNPLTLCSGYCFSFPYVFVFDRTERAHLVLDVTLPGKTTELHPMGSSGITNELVALEAQYRDCKCLD